MRVDDAVWDELKIHCIRHGMRISDALKEAIERYIKAAKTTTKAA